MQHFGWNKITPLLSALVITSQTNNLFSLSRNLFSLSSGHHRPIYCCLVVPPSPDLSQVSNKEALPSLFYRSFTELSQPIRSPAKFPTAQPCSSVGEDAFWGSMILATDNVVEASPDFGYPSIDPPSSLFLKPQLMDLAQHFSRSFSIPSGQIFSIQGFWDDYLTA